MTMPDERTRNLLQAGAFLKQLEADASLPDRIRREATRLLRHYPTLRDVEYLARQQQPFAGMKLLTADIDPKWWALYPHGVHRG
jgi:hypothetical protein